VIPATILQIAAGRRDIRLGALHPTRDFNYIKDTVRGFIAALASDSSIGNVINIGSNYEISIAETVKLIAEIMRADINIVQDEERLRPDKSEVERLWADNSMAKQLLGWEPSYNGHEGLKRGLAETISWFTSPDNTRSYKTDIYNI